MTHSLILWFISLILLAPIDGEYTIVVGRLVCVCVRVCVYAVEQPCLPSSLSLYVHIRVLNRLPACNNVFSSLLNTPQEAQMRKATPSAGTAATEASTPTPYIPTLHTIPAPDPVVDDFDLNSERFGSCTQVFAWAVCIFKLAKWHTHIARLSDCGGYCVV